MTKPEPMSKPPGPALYRLASMQQYDNIPQHVRLHPEDIACRDKYGSTVLHLLCRNQQQSFEAVILEAVDAILEVDPSVVAKPNHRSWTPLHLACEKRLLLRNERRFKDALVQKLVRAHPKALEIKLKSDNGREKTAFHLSLENGASYDTLQEMLCHEPMLATEPWLRGETSYDMAGYPLQVFWRLTKQQEKPDMSKMRLLLRAALLGRGHKRPGEIQVLQAVCAIPCPRDFASVIMSLHDNLIFKCDTDGLLPLHSAVKYATVEFGLYADFVVSWLLYRFPESAMIPFGKGNVLPLHVMLNDRGMAWDGGVKDLVLAFPGVLQLPDPRNRLVPFLSSATHADKSPMHLTTTFELLRATPEVLTDGFFEAA